MSNNTLLFSGLLERFGTTRSGFKLTLCLSSTGKMSEMTQATCLVTCCYPLRFINYRILCQDVVIGYMAGRNLNECCLERLQVETRMFATAAPFQIFMCNVDEMAKQLGIERHGNTMSRWAQNMIFCTDQQCRREEADRSQSLP